MSWITVCLLGVGRWEGDEGDVGVGGELKAGEGKNSAELYHLFQ